MTGLLAPSLLALAYIIAPPWARTPRRGAGMRPRAVGRTRRNHLPPPAEPVLRGGHGAPTGFSQRPVGAVTTPPWRERHMVDLIAFGGVAVITLAAIAAALWVTR